MDKVTKKRNFKLLIVFILVFVVAFALGRFSKSIIPATKPLSVEGTYRCDTWNGDDTVVLSIKGDGSYYLSTGRNGTWAKENEKIILTCETDNKYDDGIDECTIIGNVDGVVYHGLFFEKIS